MTYEECLVKAKEAFDLGIIELEQIDAYAQYLYEQNKGES
jgi:hypothetical protein